ncbi:MAG: GGDEF domain-containing phosphodiesterase [Candidatus Wallbacteria bacterium]|nr:GGDEF domain-containing phosphodiesterase [Candidatus Wallbacteria bacterium]
MKNKCYGPLAPEIIGIGEIREPALVIDLDDNVLFLNDEAVLEYGNPGKKKKCWQVIHGLDSPCWKNMEYPCPKKIMQDSQLDQYSAIHVHKSREGENYFLVSCSYLKEKRLIVEMHIKVSRIIDEMISHGILNADDLREVFYAKLNYLVGKDHFIKKLSNHLREKKVRFLSIMDLRGLSFINKFYGMVAGDLMIKSLEEAIFDVLRESGGESIFSRAAGDEFVVLHSTKKRSEVRKIEKAVLKRLADRTLTFVDEHIRTRISLGTLEISDTKDYHVDEVLKLLSFSKSQAKKSSEKKYYLGMSAQQDELLHEFHEKSLCFDEVQKALSENKIELFFQPIVDLNTGEIFDLEALVRIGKTGSYLPANIFIDLIYELDQILKLDSLVFKKIISYADQIAKICPRIFINIGPNSLKSKQFRKILDHTVRELSRSGLELTIELTEQSLLENADIVKFIHDKYGFHFGIDDFGTGYSSFKTVADLSNSGAVSVIKIDGSLTKGIQKSAENLTIVRAIAGMARTLNLKTIGEFIDNRVDLSVIRAIGVDLGQGYLFSKPVKIEDLLKDNLLKKIRRELK